MKKRIISISLILCVALNIFTLSACTAQTSANNTDTTDTDSTDTLDFELTKAPEQDRAILHMIKPVDALEGWQSGKTEPAAFLYIDDMMNVFDELEWKNGDEEILISGDFDFRINLNQ